MQNKEIIAGSMLSEVCFPNIAMMYKNAGMDFSIIDCEHGAFDYSQVAALVTAFRLSGVREVCSSLVAESSAFCTLLVRLE